MKKIKNVVRLLGVLLIITSCTNEEVFVEEDMLVYGAKSEFVEEINPEVPLPEIIYDEVVIHYNNPDIDNNTKESFRSSLVKKYGIVIKEIIPCSCGANDIEKLKLVYGEGEIEDMVSELSGRGGAGGVTADFQFVFNVDTSSLPTKYNLISRINRKIKVRNNSDDTVKIAVLDTGIDYSYFDKPFLYNTSGSNNCNNEISGWDFVNGDNNPFDDNNHGSIVSKIITDNLDDNDIPYQILPVKVFDNEGKGNYFDTLCGLEYVASFEEFFIVNASFGFYGIYNPEIMEEIIEDNSDKLLIVNSSGNEGNDTDLGRTKHYPSSYKLENMIVVGGFEHESDKIGVASLVVSEYNDDLDSDSRVVSLGVNSNLLDGDISYSTSLIANDLADPNDRNIMGYNVALDSNFGNTSVDVVAKFHHEFDLSNTIRAKVSGTSFAAPIVTARAALLYSGSQTNKTPKDLNYSVLGTSFTSESLDLKVGGNRIILINRLFSPGYTHSGL